MVKHQQNKLPEHASMPSNAMVAISHKRIALHGCIALILFALWVGVLLWCINNTIPYSKQIVRFFFFIPVAYLLCVAMFSHKRQCHKSGQKKLSIERDQNTVKQAFFLNNLRKQICERQEHGGVFRKGMAKVIAGCALFCFLSGGVLAVMLLCEKIYDENMKMWTVVLCVIYCYAFSFFMSLFVYVCLREGKNTNTKQEKGE